MIINSNGNVGIGTTFPFTKLDVRGTGYFQQLVLADIANTGSANNYQLRMSPPSTGYQYSSLQSIYQTVPSATYMPLILNPNGGNVSIGGTVPPNTNFEIYGSSPSMAIRAANEGDTATLFLGTGYANTGAYKAAIIAQGISNYSRSHLHFCLDNTANNTYPTYNAGLNNIRMTIKPDGNFNFYPDPFYINNTNGANYSVNLNVACKTTGLATAPFITATVADGFNGIDTITTITAQSGANSGYLNGSGMILDGSYNTNSGRGTRGSYNHLFGKIPFFPSLLMRGCNWLLSVPESSEEQILTALHQNKQKVFADCGLIAVESPQKIETVKAAKGKAGKAIMILHLKKSIRKAQVDNIFKEKILKIESRKLYGTLNQIKDELKRNGYTQFRSVAISGCTPTKRQFQKASQLTLSAHSELLNCLENDADIDTSGCTELPQTIMIVRQTIKMLVNKSNILFTNIEDLEDDIKQDQIRIDALKRERDALKAIYETKLQAEQDKYAELYQQYDRLHDRCKLLQKREAETSIESSRRVEKWMTKCRNS